MSDRLHLTIEGASRYEQGRERGRQLLKQLPEAYARYAELFRTLGISVEQEADAVEATIAALETHLPDALTELEGISQGAEIPLEHVVALNARTELLTLASRGNKECSTLVGKIQGSPKSAQTWDWHIELKEYWHTQDVVGLGYRFAGQTETGVVAKISMNEKGLGLHLNILGHEDDSPGGVPLHVLIGTIMRECATVGEAVALIRETPLSSSSSFTLLDASEAVAVEISPAGVFEFPVDEGFVTRTNHFQNDLPLRGQRSELYEPDSSERLALLRQRLGHAEPQSTDELIGLLRSGEGEAELCARPDMSLQYGQRWATLCTATINPSEKTISILDGMPTEVDSKQFTIFQLS